MRTAVALVAGTLLFGLIAPLIPILFFILPAPRNDFATRLLISSWYELLGPPAAMTGLALSALLAAASLGRPLLVEPARHPGIMSAIAGAFLMTAHIVLFHPGWNIPYIAAPAGLLMAVLAVATAPLLRRILGMRPIAAAQPPEKRDRRLVAVFVAVALVGIAVSALRPAPSEKSYYQVRSVREARTSVEALKPRLIAFRAQHKRWPANNADLGWPADGLEGDAGRHVLQMQADGSVLARFYRGCRDASACSKIWWEEYGAVSLRLAAHADGDLVWVCGHARAPFRYEAIGENRTTMKSIGLPTNCE